MELRRRKRGVNEGAFVPADVFVESVATCQRVVIFTGSGLSASSGMSMFSTRNGLYERARKRFKISDGIKLFTYSFYKQRRAEVQAFFAQIYSEAQGSQAAPGHHALAAMAALGRIRRHYTLNIDGLAEAVGISTWHHADHPEGITVEMHGNIRQLVCPSCHAVEPLSRHHITTMKELASVPCKACSSDSLRFKIMLYDDDEGDCITPEHVFETLEEDLEVADCVLWLGISFEQSASVEYFRRVRSLLASLGRLNQVTQAIINPSDDAYFNVISGCSNLEDLRLLDVRATADELLPQLAVRMKADSAGEAPQRVATPHLLLGGQTHAMQAARTSSNGIAPGSVIRRTRGGLAQQPDDYVYDYGSDEENQAWAGQQAPNGWGTNEAAGRSVSRTRRSRLADGNGSNSHRSSPVPAYGTVAASGIGLSTQIASMPLQGSPGVQSPLIEHVMSQLGNWQQQLEGHNQQPPVGLQQAPAPQQQQPILLLPPGMQLMQHQLVPVMQQNGISQQPQQPFMPQTVAHLHNGSMIQQQLHAAMLPALGFVPPLGQQAVLPQLGQQAVLPQPTHQNTATLYNSPLTIPQVIGQQPACFPGFTPITQPLPTKQIPLVNYQQQLPPHATHIMLQSGAAPQHDASHMQCKPILDHLLAHPELLAHPPTMQTAMQHVFSITAQSHPAINTIQAGNTSQEQALNVPPQFSGGQINGPSQQIMTLPLTAIPLPSQNTTPPPAHVQLAHNSSPPLKTSSPHDVTVQQFTHDDVKPKTPACDVKTQENALKGWQSAHGVVIKSESQPTDMKHSLDVQHPDHCTTEAVEAGSKETRKERLTNHVGDQVMLPIPQQEQQHVVKAEQTTSSSHLQDAQHSPLRMQSDSPSLVSHHSHQDGKALANVVTGITAGICVSPCATHAAVTLSCAAAQPMEQLSVTATI